MIALSHFGNGKRIALNVDLIEKVEETPDTVITLTNGARYLVQESLDEIIDKSIEVRARSLYMAQHLPDPRDRQGLRLLRGGDGGDVRGHPADIDDPAQMQPPAGMDQQGAGDVPGGDDR